MTKDGEGKEHSFFAFAVFIIYSLQEQGIINSFFFIAGNEPLYWGKTAGHDIVFSKLRQYIGKCIQNHKLRFTKRKH